MTNLRRPCSRGQFVSTKSHVVQPTGLAECHGRLKVCLQKVGILSVVTWIWVWGALGAVKEKLCLSFTSRRLLRVGRGYLGCYGSPWTAVHHPWCQPPPPSLGSTHLNACPRRLREPRTTGATIRFFFQRPEKVMWVIVANNSPGHQTNPPPLYKLRQSPKLIRSLHLL